MRIYKRKNFVLLRDTETLCLIVLHKSGASARVTLRHYDTDPLNAFEREGNRQYRHFVIAALRKAITLLFAERDAHE